MCKKALLIFRECIPLLMMVGIIPLILNDYLLAILYLVIGVILIIITRKNLDGLVYVVGCIAMTIFEFIFIETKVEVFERNSLFGLMPIWLPFLWAYGFVVIKRSVRILES